jgi:Co/Zn/Cd efflux system component
MPVPAQHVAQIVRGVGKQRWQAGAAVAKGAFMLAFGVGVLGDAAYKIVFPLMPRADTMGVVGTIALAANLLCLFLLYRYRSDNLNMRSTWLCSRNDVIANLGVLGAAAASYGLGSQWPDIAVGVAIAGVFLRSAAQVLFDAIRAFRMEVPSLPFPRRDDGH